MPHFTVEYSANLDDAVDMAAFCTLIRDAALETRVFPLGGIRVRAVRCESYAIADGDPANAFIDIALKMGSGRDLKTRKTAAKEIYDAMLSHLDHLLNERPFALSFQVLEMDPELSFKTNSIHQRMNI